MFVEHTSMQVLGMFGMFVVEGVDLPSPSLPTSCETLLFMEVMSPEGEIGAHDVGREGPLCCGDRF